MNLKSYLCHIKKEVAMNVYQLAKNRLKTIFNDFDNIYVSFSGGKDSGVLLNLCIQYIREHDLNRKIGVVHFNYEAEYQLTRNYVDRTFKENQDILEFYNVCVPVKVTTCTSMFQTYWRPWEESKKDIWVNELPNRAFTSEDFDYYDEMMFDYEFQRKFSQWHHQRNHAQKTCILIGLRTEESLNRWSAIHSEKNYRNYKGINWTKEIADNIYNAYPIFDWNVEDVWVANGKFEWDYNKLYDLFYKAGVPLHNQRVASPFLSEGKSSLRLFKTIEPHTWGKLISRVNGVNFTGIYGNTTAMGWGKITKPDHYTWKQFMFFLLSTLPEATKQGYLNKLETSIRFWKKRGGVLDDTVIQELKDRSIPIKVGKKTNYKSTKKPVRMEYQDDIDIKRFKLIPTYKRMCVCIMKNDHLCKYMGFALNKKEMEKRRSAEKYKDLL